MCVGIDEIRDIALGLEMEGLENWQYPYQKVIIDDKQGEIVGFWKQVVIDGDGAQSGDLRHRRQLVPAERRRQDRMATRLLRLRPRAGAVPGPDEGREAVSKGMQKRIERSLAGEKLPGYYPLGKAPVPIW